MSLLSKTSIALSAISASEILQGSWLNTALTPDERANALIAEMTKTEKIQLLFGDSADPYTGHTAGIPRLSIPDLNMNDGPQGFRYEGANDTSTQMPAAIKVAASWDTEVAGLWGKTMGKEFHGKGSNVQLGPGLNVNRIPISGRNFEYLSGEDPFLGYTLVQPVVKGIQSEKVMANAKHFIDNSQETDRLFVNEIIDERTQFELYYPPFVGAIEAGVGSFMCSYNKVNGKWACENKETLTTDLRDRLGFEGFVMSDWSATHNLTDIYAGLDQDQNNNGPDVWNKDTLKEIPEEDMNTPVYRILTSMMKVGIFDDKNTNTIDSIVTNDENKRIAKEINEQSIVLLKNDGALPLDKTKKQKILILGEDDLAYNARSHGTGSGAVHNTFVQPPLLEFCDRLGVKRFDDVKFPRTHCSDSREHCITYGGSRNSQFNMFWKYDTAVVFIGGVMAGEDHDRPSIGFSDEVNQMITNLGKKNKLLGKKTVVVMSIPGVVSFPWAEHVDAIIADFYGGEQMSPALLNVIYGDVNPSGKLPVTLQHGENDQQMTQEQYPGVDATSTYTEKLEVGYRWFDAHQVEPLFPFGHGLSYTSFDFNSFEQEGKKIKVELENTGELQGSEVVQLYLGFPAEAEEPPKLLKGFSKVKLGPGESADVNFELTDRDLSIWDVETHDWKLVQGTFDLYIGTSSRDITYHMNFQVLNDQIM